MRRLMTLLLTLALFGLPGLAHVQAAGLHGPQVASLHGSLACDEHLSAPAVNGHDTSQTDEPNATVGCALYCALQAGAPLPSLTPAGLLTATSSAQIAAGPAPWFESPVYGIFKPPKALS